MLLGTLLDNLGAADSWSTHGRCSNRLCFSALQIYDQLLHYVLILTASLLGVYMCFEALDLEACAKVQRLPPDWISYGPLSKQHSCT